MIKILEILFRVLSLATLRQFRCSGSTLDPNQTLEQSPRANLTLPGICLIDSSRGSGICLSYTCTGDGYCIVVVAEDTGDLTFAHLQILRQQNLVSGTHVGGFLRPCALVVKWSTQAVKNGFLSDKRENIWLRRLSV